MRYKKCGFFTDALRCDLCRLERYMRGMIFSAIAGVLLILSTYVLFGGPCRVVLFFHVPGGSFTVVMYYVLWCMMFAAAGAELYLMKRCTAMSGDVFTLHLTAHLCLIAWYPLFFTTYAQLLALAVIGAAGVLLVLAAKDIIRAMPIVFVSLIAKCAVCAVYFYVTLAFIVIN